MQSVCYIYTSIAHLNTACYCYQDYWLLYKWRHHGSVHLFSGHQCWPIILSSIVRRPYISGMGLFSIGTVECVCYISQKPLTKECPITAFHQTQSALVIHIHTLGMRTAKVAMYPVPGTDMQTWAAIPAQQGRQGRPLGNSLHLLVVPPPYLDEWQAVTH